MRPGAIIVAVLLATAACHATKTGAPTTGPTHRPTGGGEILRGYATWYGSSAGQDGGPTASGERFSRRALTAAHRSLPMGTMVRVTETRSGRSVVVRINDRGPYGRDRSRIIDLSEAAAKRIGIIDAGVAPVTIEILSRPPHR